MKLTNFIKDVGYAEDTAQIRRKVLIEQMHQKISKQQDCFNCKGYCCTYSYNSMRVTPLEALDVYFYLLNKNLINQSLVKKLEKNIKDFRLDREVYISGDKELRRYYTCPFYKTGAKGCGIGLGHKPYGCIAFMPYETNVSIPGKCSTNTQVLIEREILNPEDDLINQNIRNFFGLYWTKKDLPSALMHFVRTFNKNLNFNI